MIFVTSGSSPLGYDALFKYCDEFAIQYNQYVFEGQIGGSEYIPKNFESKRWYTNDEMINKIKESSLIISHAGFGIISECLRLGKKMIVIPRNSGADSYHSQNSLAEFLHKKGYLLCAKSFEELGKYILSSNDLKLREYDFNSNIPDIVNDYILDLIKEREN